VIQESRLTFWILFGLFAATILVGYIGWWHHLVGEEDRVLRALYLTLLSFGGDGVYVVSPIRDAATGDARPLGPLISLAGFLGLVTTISAILGLLVRFLAIQIARYRRFFRPKRQIVIGASSFAVDHAERDGPVTVYDSEDLLAALPVLKHRYQSLRVPKQLRSDVATGYGRILRPKRVIFGDRDAITNVERARSWLLQVPKTYRKDLEVVLRIEENAVARELSYLSDVFDHATVISRAETVARALVTGMTPTELALLRGQDQVHVVLVGLGSVNLALAEELILRAHHPDLGPTQITIVDQNESLARARLRSERPDLLNPDFKDDGPHIHWEEMDALECCSIDCAQRLLAIEHKRAITAVVVAAGDDTVNTGIAMRLRQLQLERLAIKAPIFMRSDARNSVAPGAVADVTGGIVSFGGRTLDAEDFSQEKLFHDLAERVHNVWRNSDDVVRTKENEWGNLTTIDRRSSYRAAMSSVEHLYSAGCVPPSQTTIAGLRLEPEAAARLLKDDAAILRLAKNEHKRWNAERRAEGYRNSGSALRDNEKKLHPHIKPWEKRGGQQLQESQKVKDINNIREVLRAAKSAHRRHATCWRPLVRVGIFGPLRPSDAVLRDTRTLWRDYILSGDYPHLEDATLEILTPNAPGFDRTGAAVLLDEWKKVTGRSGRVVLVNATTEATLNDKAAAHFHGNAWAKMPGHEKEKVLQPLRDQSSTLAKAAQHVRVLDLRDPGTSDTDRLESPKGYDGTIEDGQEHVLKLSNICVFAANQKSAGWTTTALNAWSGPEKHTVVIP